MLLLLLSTWTLFLCFIVPLTLTGKLLSKVAAFEATRDKSLINSATVMSNFQFLLHYWVCFAAVMMIENLFQVQLLMSFGGPLGTCLHVLSSITKLWLFYGHGCLIVTKCYLPTIAGRISGSRRFSFSRFERSRVHPMTVILFSRQNYLLSWSLGLLSYVFPASANFVRNFISRSPYDNSFLDFCLKEICYVDSMDDLHSQYNETRAFLGGLVSSVANATSEPPRMRIKNRGNVESIPEPRITEFRSSSSSTARQPRMEKYDRTPFIIPVEKKNRRSFSNPECDPVMWKSRGRSVSCNDQKMSLPDLRNNYQDVFSLNRAVSDNLSMQLVRRSRIGSPQSIASNNSYALSTMGSSIRSVTPISINEVFLPTPVSVTQASRIMSPEAVEPDKLQKYGTKRIVYRLDPVTNMLVPEESTKQYTINREFFEKNKHKFMLPPLNPTAVRFVQAHTAPYPTEDKWNI